MSMMASKITSLTIVYSTVYSGAEQRKLQGSVSPAFVRGIHQWQVNSPHKRPVTQKVFPFDDIIMSDLLIQQDHTAGASFTNTDELNQYQDWDMDK